MIKNILRNIILKEKADSKKYVAFLRKKGVEIGENVRFFSPSNTLIDMSAPWLISIGNNVNITHGVIIITHDYSWSVIKQ
ncbi:MAG: acyltransferase, partial [Ruminococcus sp.]|nr:acyltransferase [Ruminococcus sp.]